MKRILFLVAHRPGRSPGQRFRFEQYLEYLRQKGFSIEFSYLLNEKDDAYFYSKGHYLKKLLILIKSIGIRLKDVKRSGNFDLIFIYREAVMFGSAYFERRLKRKGAKIILDFDDAIWLMDVSDGNKNLRWMKRPSKTADILKLSDMVFVGNRFLADYALQFNQSVKIIPTTIETETFQKKKLNKNSDRVCIGWIGSHTTSKHFALAVPFLKELTEKFSDRIYIKLISDENYPTNEIDVYFCMWNKDSEIEDLLEFDIGIMPLPDDEWAKGKCGFKGLQYMSLEIPAILSPVGVNSEIIQDGVNGYLASTKEEWIEKISVLIESAELREMLGKNGRKTVEEKYSFNAWKERYVESLKEITGKQTYS